MTISASLTLLPRADGSATFTAGRITVIASVSGPMEVKSRDELPDQTFIEIIVRPAVGVGGVYSLHDATSSTKYRQEPVNVCLNLVSSPL
jgi:ribonuclease PH